MYVESNAGQEVGEEKATEAWHLLMEGRGVLRVMVGRGTLGACI